MADTKQVMPPLEQDANPWRIAVIDEAATLFLSEDGAPRDVLKRVIAANVQIALDPAVSSEAQALIDRGAAVSNALLRQALEALEFVSVGFRANCVESAITSLQSALQQQETRETALRVAGAAGAVPDPDVVGAPVVGVSGSDWECVGAFRFNNYGGWQQLAKEYEEDPDATKLYRKRTAGVALPDGADGSRKDKT